jgi:hypothetical protein
MKIIYNLYDSPTTVIDRFYDYAIDTNELEYFNLLYEYKFKCTLKEKTLKESQFSTKFKNDTIYLHYKDNKYMIDHNTINRYKYFNSIKDVKMYLNKSLKIELRLEKYKKLCIS